MFMVRMLGKSGSAIRSPSVRQGYCREKGASQLKLKKEKSCIWIGSSWHSQGSHFHLLPVSTWRILNSRPLGIIRNDSESPNGLPIELHKHPEPLSKLWRLHLICSKPFLISSSRLCSVSSSLLSVHSGSALLLPGYLFTEVLSNKAAVPMALCLHLSSFEIPNWGSLPTSWEMAKTPSGPARPPTDSQRTYLQADVDPPQSYR